jgi:hypothetical protein
MNLCRECGRVNGCHPHCPNAEDISAFEEFCEMFNAEMVSVYTNRFIADVNAKREEKGLRPLPQHVLIETSDYKCAIRAYFKSTSEEK